LAPAPASVRLDFQSDLSAALAIASQATTRKTNSARQRIFAIWADFCAAHGATPCLSSVADPEAKICHLLVFAYRYRQTGQTGKPVRADTVQDALLAVGKGISDLGQPGSRFPLRDRNQHPLLASFLKRLRSEDSPATRAYPVNITIIKGLPTALASGAVDIGGTAASLINLILVAFFWLLRPCEYLAGKEDGQSTPFCLEDLSFTAHGRLYSADDPSLNDVQPSDLEYASLTFTDQKNGVRGEQITQGCIDNINLCPVRALACIASRLRHYGAPPTAPIHQHFFDGRWTNFRSSHVTAALRASAGALRSQTGIDPALLSARSLRPGGATALLCARVDSDSIKLLGRWKSDAMFRYLRIQALAYSVNLAQQMLNHGAYTFSPGVYIESNHDPLPAQIPTDLVAALQLDGDPC